MTSDNTDSPGRPSGYKPEFCQALIDNMAQGLSIRASMAELGYTRFTAYNWAEKYPEFKEAMEMGKGRRVLFLERGLLKSSGKSTTKYIFALKNADPEEWRDRREFDVGGRDGKPIEIHISPLESNY